MMEKLGVLLPDVVAGVVQSLSANVQEIERKRGVGVDQVLRYGKLVVSIENGFNFVLKHIFR